VKQRVFKTVFDVQKVHDRTPVAREWLESARKQQNSGQVFSAFFSAYIALVISATQVKGDSSGKYPSGADDQWERESIEDAMLLKSKEIALFLDSEDGKKIKQAIWQREIPENQKIRIIGPANDSDLEKAAKKLATYFSPSRTSGLSKEHREDQAKQLAVLLRKVRNRLFHGGKLYDPEGTDAELINKLNPLTINLVEILQRH
jgi:hypothetical protein